MPNHDPLRSLVGCWGKEGSTALVVETGRRRKEAVGICKLCMHVTAVLQLSLRGAGHDQSRRLPKDWDSTMSLAWRSGFSGC